MRLLEYFIAGIILIALAVRLLPGLRKKIGFPYLPLLAGIIIPIHLLMEGFRWQMIPLFVITLGFILISLGQHYRRSGNSYLIRNKKFRIITQVFVLILFISSVVFPVLLPIVNLPEPGGPYEVGTISFRMVDYEREEIFTKDSLDFRNLLVTAWYPAEIEKGTTKSTYWDKKSTTGKVYSMSAGMGKFWYTHLSLVKTNSYAGAPVLTAESPFPVIIYSPSFYGMNSDHAFIRNYRICFP